MKTLLLVLSFLLAFAALAAGFLEIILPTTTTHLLLGAIWCCAVIFVWDVKP